VQNNRTRPPARLIEGYRRFRDERFAGEAARYKALAEGQSPQTMIIGCADSRVAPSMIFSAFPGELFVARNVGAIVPPCEDQGMYHGTSASLEFAVAVLEVSDIVVLGHGLCGGVAAALAATAEHPLGRFIGPWVKLLGPLRDQVLGDSTLDGATARQTALEHLAVQYSLENLKSFPFVAEAIEQGRLALHGAWFSIAEGRLYWFDPDRVSFDPVDI